jgi:hypothetical protein
MFILRNLLQETQERILLLIRGPACACTRSRRPGIRRGNGFRRLADRSGSRLEWEGRVLDFDLRVERAVYVDGSVAGCAGTQRLRVEEGGRCT